MFKNQPMRVGHIKLIQNLLGLGASDFHSFTGLNPARNMRGQSVDHDDQLRPPLGIFLRFLMAAQEHLNFEQPRTQEIYEILQKGDPELSQAEFAYLFGLDPSSSGRLFRQNLVPRTPINRYYFFIKQMSKHMPADKILAILREQAHEEAEARGLILGDLPFYMFRWTDKGKERLEEILKNSPERRRYKQGPSKSPEEELNKALKAIAASKGKPFKEPAFNEKVSDLTVSKPLLQFCKEQGIELIGDLLLLGEDNLIGIHKLGQNRLKAAKSEILIGLGLKRWPAASRLQRAK